MPNLEAQLRYAIAQILKEARKKKCLSQKDIASRMGVKQPVISKWEKDLGGLSASGLIELAGILDVLDIFSPMATEEVKNLPPDKQEWRQEIDKIWKEIVKLQGNNGGRQDK